MALNLAAILVPLSAMAESPDVSAGQEAADRPDFEHRFARPLVYNPLPEQRYPDQFRRSDSWSDRAAVPPLRRLDRCAIKRRGATFARGQCANRQSLSSL
jgi:hypothetical protein